MKLQISSHWMREAMANERRTENQNGERRVVVALRERFGRTLTFVRQFERDGVELAKAIVAPGAAIFADEASHWDVLEASFAMVCPLKSGPP